MRIFGFGIIFDSSKEKTLNGCLFFSKQNFPRSENIDKEYAGEIYKPF